MRVIISPSKRMCVDTDSIEGYSTPLFIKKAENLIHYIKQLSLQEAKELWRCSEKLAKQYKKQIQEINQIKNLTPALLAYDGIQYQYMSPIVFEDNQWEYAQKHIRILSGLYGLLKPLDGITPYRLEMQTKLCVDGRRNLYEFWGDDIYRALKKETDIIINLASKEYAKCITDWLEKGVQVITCIFAQLEQGRLVQKGVYVKMARGEMVRFMAENKISHFEELKKFTGLGYQFQKDFSRKDVLVFTKEEK